ncbi:MAG: hypothetical protein IPJ13_29600 [Saprospiraceae bacterium]|nr:hypothetical protein [Saprospiraceae bacterium]
MIGWILLVFLPDWKYTQVLILNGVVVFFSILYSYLIGRDIGVLIQIVSVLWPM